LRRAGSGVGREREETWLKRTSEDGMGEEENTAITGQKRDGERMHGGAARRRERDDGEVAGRIALRKAGW